MRPEILFETAERSAGAGWTEHPDYYLGGYVSGVGARSYDGVVHGSPLGVEIDVSTSGTA